MADSQEIRQAFEVAYVGENADDHAMDVEDLGPALLAFGKLVRAANKELNQDRAYVKVLVASNFEHKCFNINFEVIQTILDAIQDFLGDKQAVENLTKILTKIGVIVGPVGVVATGLFAFLKWRKGRKIEKVEQSSNGTILKIEGDHNVIHIDNSVWQLSNNREVLQAVDWILSPVRHGNGKAIEFKQGGRPITVLRKQDVEEIGESIDAPPPDEPEEEEVAEDKKVITGSLFVYSPVFDPKAPMWRFSYRGKHIYADIRETSIAADAVRRGGSFINDRYKVRMEVTPSDKEDGGPHYRIIEVLEFTQAEQQIQLPLKKRRKSVSKAARD